MVVSDEPLLEAVEHSSKLQHRSQSPGYLDLAPAAHTPRMFGMLGNPPTRSLEHGPLLGCLDVTCGTMRCQSLYCNLPV